MRRNVKGRFTRGYNETHVEMGKPDHSGQELQQLVHVAFINELKLPVHRFPVVEVRKYYLSNGHQQSLTE